MAAPLRISTFSEEVRRLLPGPPFDALDAEARHLDSHRIAVFSANDVSPVAKIPYKARELHQALVRRTLELYESFVRDCNDKAFTPLFVTARALLETIALGVDISRRTADILKSADDSKLPDLDDMLMRALLGSKSEGWGVPEEYKAINVLTTIGHAEKASGLGLNEAYACLSEHAHPNAFGLLFAYSSQNVTDRRSVFIDRPFVTRLDAVELVVGAAGGSVSLLASAVHDFEDSLPDFVAFCEAAIHKGGTWPATMPYPRAHPPTVMLCSR